MIKPHPPAAKIKLADLRHNSDVTRLNSIDEKKKIQFEKYKSAIMLFEEESE